MSVIKALHSCDTWLFFWIQPRNTGQRTRRVRLARALSRSADGPLYLALMLFLAALGTTQTLELLNQLILGLAAERALYFGLKNGIRRQRPSEALSATAFITPGDRFSFPSGHTSAAFLVATLIALNAPWMAPLALLWAASIGLSRVILGVHFPGDTLVGAGLGAALGCIIVKAGIQ